MERFALAGWRALTLAGLAARAAGDRQVGEREFVITFDDAYRGLREHAFPVLEACGFRATCFVITEYAGRLNRWDVAYGGRRFPHLSWRDMRAWQGRGIDFASHTATHPRLTWLGSAAVAREMSDSRRTLQVALGAAPDAVSYPFGAAGMRERRLASEAGYSLGFTLAGPWVSGLLAIPRLPVYVWSPPMPGASWLVVPERLAAISANRASVGTTLWRRLTA